MRKYILMRLEAIEVHCKPDIGYKIRVGNKTSVMIRVVQAGK